MYCKNCGNEYEGNFCSVCSEKKFDTRQLGFKYFVEETFESFVHFDNKFFRTLKTLVRNPGQLSLDFTQGRRIRYMRPVQFFLVMNLIFFFFTSGNNMYSLSLGNYVLYKPFTNYNTVQIVNKKLQSSKQSFSQYEPIFDEKMITDSKEFIFLFIPFYGLLFYLLLFWKKKYFMEHLSFAAHFVSFILLWTLIEYYVVIRPFYWITKANYSQVFDNFSAIFTSTTLSIYFGLAMHRFYKTPLVVTVLFSLGIGATFFTFIQYYRMLLFYKILFW